MANRRLTCRTGKSLIEMLVVIATMATLLTIAAQVLSRLGRSERTVRESGVIGQAEVRLTRLFRQDARQSLSAELLNEEGPSIQFTLRNGVVTYQASPNGVSRKFTASDGTPHDDTFRLGAVDVTFEIESERLAIAKTTLRKGNRDVGRSVFGEFQIVANIAADLPSGTTSSAISPQTADLERGHRGQLAPAEAQKPNEEAK